MNICVFCGSREGTDPGHAQLAEAFGTLLGERGHTLVYGGGGVGIMGIVARACKAAGGRVEGIIPESLIGTEHAWEEADQMIQTATMHQRKQLMEARADAFVALPGGFGTLEEVAEVLTLKILNYHNEPMILLPGTFWQPLQATLDHFIDTGFASPSYRRLYDLADTPEQALNLCGDRV